MDISSLISSSCADLNNKYVVLLWVCLVDNISNRNLNDFKNRIQMSTFHDKILRLFNIYIEVSL